MIKNSILVVTHKFMPEFPDDALVEYLNRNKCTNILHIIHSFSDAKDRKSRFVWYKNGKVFQHSESLDFKFLPEPLVYIKELIYTLLVIFKSGKRWGLGIGMDGLCTNIILFLRSLGVVKKVVYWSIDFVPDSRFKQPYKNLIYKFINTSAFSKADEMWDHTDRMVEQKQKILGLTPKSYRFHRVVPQGIWLDKMPKTSYENSDKYGLVFMGHLLEKQGVQLIISSLPSLIKKYRDLSFTIIGGGPFSDDLILLSKKLKVYGRCNFMGIVKDNREIEKIIAKSAVAVAPYVKRLDTFTQFGGDPGKIKTYLACGVPVLTTSVPWISKTISEKKCGVITRESVEEITQAVEFLLQSDINKSYRKNALDFAKTFDNQGIFSQINFNK